MVKYITVNDKEYAIYNIDDFHDFLNEIGFDDFDWNDLIQRDIDNQIEAIVNSGDDYEIIADGYLNALHSIINEISDVADILISQKSGKNNTKVALGNRLKNIVSFYGAQV